MTKRSSGNRRQIGCAMSPSVFRMFRIDHEQDHHEHHGQHDEHRPLWRGGRRGSTWGRGGAHVLTACTPGMNVRPSTRVADAFKSLPVHRRSCAAELRSRSRLAGRIRFRCPCPVSPSVQPWMKPKLNLLDCLSHRASSCGRRWNSGAQKGGGTFQACAQELHQSPSRPNSAHGCVNIPRRGWRWICAWARWLRPRVRRLTNCCEACAAQSS